MDDVTDHLDDQKEFLDAKLDKAWLSSIKSNASDDKEDPDQEEVSCDSETFYDALEIHDNVVLPIVSPAPLPPDDSPPFCIWSLCKPVVSLLLFILCNVLCFIDSNLITLRITSLLIVNRPDVMRLLASPLETLVCWIKSKVKNHIDSSPCPVGSKFACPSSLMVLSCVMMVNWFVSIFVSKDHLKAKNESVFGGTQVFKLFLSCSLFLLCAKQKFHL